MLQVLAHTPVLALYFSAHWCPPCRQFTPLLARAHAQAKQAGMADKERLNSHSTIIWGEVGLSLRLYRFFYIVAPFVLVNVF